MSHLLSRGNIVFPYKEVEFEGQTELRFKLGFIL